MYRFEYANGKKYGAVHGAELKYVWSNPAQKQGKPYQQALALAMHSAWVAFIKTGDPNGGALPHWPLYNNQSRQVMLFDTINRVSPLKQVFDDKNFPPQVFKLEGTGR